MIQETIRYINSVNATLENSKKIQLPKFYILTAFYNPVFAEYAKKEGVAAVYEKPMNKDVLKSLLDL